MAISNSGVGIRPGVCTSTTRPTAPYEGQHIYETDTDIEYVWNGSAWVVNYVSAASPTFTGTPTAPTAADGTNTTQLATTAFVTAGITAVGGSTSFTPSITNLTIGNGTRTGTYVQVGKIVYFQMNVTFGSTTTLTGNADLTLPVAPTGRTTFDTIAATCNFVDVSPTGIYLGYPIIVGSTIRLLATLTNSTYAVQSDIGAAVPFTWTTGDFISVSGIYQVA